MESDSPHPPKNHGTALYSALFFVPAACFVGGIAFLFYTSNRLALHKSATDVRDLPLYAQITQWFDPFFFQYNLALLVFAVVIVPLITYCYVRSMGQEKLRRLRRELPASTFENQEAVNYIQSYLKKTFTIRNYFGSMITLTLIVLFGCTIILLLKPMPFEDAAGLGVDYSKGANFLMLGPYMQAYMLGKPEEYVPVLINTLTAFQFGFMGAYVYFIGHLVRSYFTLDMTPDIFISSSVRMMTGSLLALVICYLLIDPKLATLVPLVQDDTALHEALITGLPVWSFLIGFFPSRGIVLIENVSAKALGWVRVREYASPLSDLPGMNYAHEIRLIREGFDNIENLANASALDLALRTGFTYRQLDQWIDQARLHGHLREDYHLFVERTGITQLSEFIFFWHAARQKDPVADPSALLISATHTDKHDFREKIRILGLLSEDNIQQVTMHSPQSESQHGLFAERTKPQAAG